MENLVNKNLFAGVYNKLRVLVTGHTGFKGSWLAYWLSKLDAEVYGFSLQPPTIPNHFELLNTSLHSIIGDIRDYENLSRVINEIQPDIVFHLAAQALVRKSYNNPIETYSTNVLGTLNLFEACRFCDSVRAIINITSDKCYENKEWIWGYRENDPMGGHDPYSSSKGCSEILTASYRKSYFSTNNTLLASARAGNVIGGGDWADDRLIPDIVKAANNKKKVFIRSPYATRPWQHILEPLSGYLTLGWHLLKGKKEFAEGWNFSPNNESNISVKKAVTISKNYWDKISFKINSGLANLHEANLLMLDCSKAYKLLKWKPVWNLDKTFEKTINWYKSYYEEQAINTEKDLKEYVNNAINQNVIWTR